MSVAAETERVVSRLLDEARPRSLDDAYAVVARLYAVPHRSGSYVLGAEIAELVRVWWRGRGR